MGRVEVRDHAEKIQVGSMVSWDPQRPTSDTSSIVRRGTMTQWVLDSGRRVRKSDGYLFDPGGTVKTFVQVVDPRIVSANTVNEDRNRHAALEVSNLCSYADRTLRHVGYKIGVGQGATLMSSEDALEVMQKAALVHEGLVELANLIRSAVTDDDST